MCIVISSSSLSRRRRPLRLLAVRLPAAVRKGDHQALQREVAFGLGADRSRTWRCRRGRACGCSRARARAPARAPARGGRVSFGSDQHCCLGRVWVAPPPLAWRTTRSQPLPSLTLSFLSMSQPQPRPSDPICITIFRTRRTSGVEVTWVCRIPLYHVPWVCGSALYLTLGI